MPELLIAVILPVQKLLNHTGTRRRSKLLTSVLAVVTLRDGALAQTLRHGHLATVLGHGGVANPALQVDAGVGILPEEGRPGGSEPWVVERGDDVLVLAGLVQLPAPLVAREMKALREQGDV